MFSFVALLGATWQKVIHFQVFHCRPCALRMLQYQFMRHGGLDLGMKICRRTGMRFQALPIEICIV